MLDFYEPDEVEFLAQAAERGLHRNAGRAAIGDEELVARRREDQARFIPLSDEAAQAFASLLERDEFTGADDLVFCNRLGRPLNGAVLRRRFKRTAAAAGLRVLRFHSLRHGAGSLVARQADARWVQGFLGHSKLATTERYLHAKARPEDVERLNRAFATDARDRPSEITA